MRRSLLQHQQVSGSIPSFVAEEQEEGCWCFIGGWDAVVGGFKQSFNSHSLSLFLNQVSLLFCPSCFLSFLSLSLGNHLTFLSSLNILLLLLSLFLFFTRRMMSVLLLFSSGDKILFCSFLQKSLSLSFKCPIYFSSYFFKSQSDFIHSHKKYTLLVSLLPIFVSLVWLTMQ